MSIHFLTRSFLWWCAVLTVIILFGFFAYRTGTVLYHNHQLREQFPATTNASPYEQGMPMEQMDLTVYAPYFPSTFTALYYPLTHRIKTPVTLKYYDEIPNNETAVALEIVKGTTIVAIPEATKGSAFQEAGYGYTSYPTYVKGWRYVRPFIAEEGLNQAHYKQYYYVNIDSLEAVLDKVIEVNQPFHDAIRQQGWSLNKGKHVIARYIDNALYQHGAYLSPDLLYRIIDRWNVVLLSAIGLITISLLSRSLGFLRNRR